MLPTDKEIIEKSKKYGNHIFWFPSNEEKVQKIAEEAFIMGAKAMREKAQREIDTILKRKQAVHDFAQSSGVEPDSKLSHRKKTPK